MGDIKIIVFCLVVLVFLGALFFCVDYVTKDRASKDSGAGKERERAKPASDEAGDNVKAGNKTEMKAGKVEDSFVEELNQNNLANDIQFLIESDKKGDNDASKERVFRSRLANTGRMKQYYEKKHSMRVDKYSAFGVKDEDAESESGSVTLGNLTLSKEEMEKLMNLQAILNKKSDE